MEEIQNFILEHVELIEVSNKSLAEASSRAAKFLVAQAVISAEILRIKDSLSKLETLKAVRYAQAVDAAEGKNITEKKGQAEKDPNYTEAREQYETAEANISYLKTHLDIFNNAHIQFRNLAKE